MNYLSATANLALATALFAFATPAFATSNRPPTMKAALSIVSPSLKDPDSAKFRGTYMIQDNKEPAAITVCGEINAKNSYGA